MNMSNYDITPSPEQGLHTDEQIRAYVNPTRMTILSYLSQEKDSVSGIARRLNVHPANLTHHFKLLEKVGLIQLVEKRETGKNLEKLYRASAYHYTVQVEGKIANKKLLALSILRDNLTAALHRLDRKQGDQNVLAILKTVRLDPKDVTRFQQKLMTLSEEFEKRSFENGLAYSLNASLYPTEVGDLGRQEITIRPTEDGENQP
jgi:DNA-binding transcriptional ArsR family regulator